MRKCASENYKVLFREGGKFAACVRTTIHLGRPVHDLVSSRENRYTYTLKILQASNSIPAIKLSQFRLYHRHASMHSSALSSSLGAHPSIFTPQCVFVCTPPTQVRQLRSIPTHLTYLPTYLLQHSSNELLALSRVAGCARDRQAEVIRTSERGGNYVRRNVVLCTYTYESESQPARVALSAGRQRKSAKINVATLLGL